MLQREPIFGELQYRSHQICFVHDFALRNGDPELSPRQLSRAFGCSVTRLKAALDNGLNDPKVHDRHFAFDGDSEVQILDWIQRQAEKSRPVARTDLKHYCKATYSRSISGAWVDSFTLRHRADLFEAKSTPQEHVRLEVPRACLHETTHCLREHVQGMKVELVFNLEEIGMSEWHDRKEKKVIVPTFMDGQTSHHRGIKGSQAHINHHMHHRRKRVPEALYRHVARL
jgi:hypothetical protein